MKLWQGRFQKETDKAVNDFNSSLRFDSRMFEEDIKGSIAHATMLAHCGIISADDLCAIESGLTGILSDIREGKLIPDPECEDIHTFVEGELTKRVGDPGKRLHTARSRNDQVAVDTRMYLRTRLSGIRDLIAGLIDAIDKKARENRMVIMPGYTHMQRAQPVTFAHHILAYSQMLSRDIGRLDDCVTRLNSCPLGSCALAGTTYPTNRAETSELLGFTAPCENSLDGVSDRDFCIEALSMLSILMMHLSRFSEEIILWCSWEFKFIELDDAFSTGSSIMPQKKNPDIAELVRGKTGRVYGSLMAMLTVMKGLPLAYNKDMQEDKEGLFDALDTVQQCLEAFTPMLLTMRLLPDNMRRAAAGGFINATDCADYLTKRGVPFRDAYRLTGELVAYCIQHGKTLETLTLDEYKAHSPVFGEDIYEAVALEACTMNRTSYGAAGYTEKKLAEGGIKND